jgi:mevalonate kinase
MRSKSYDIAGKVFILGEYAVLGGLPAVAASVAPRFSGSLSRSASREDAYHPESPVGRFLLWAWQERGLNCSFHFEDPYHTGGFGASTAQFAIAYAAAASGLNLRRDWRSVWRFYRNLMGTDGIAPSGADLAAQLCGGVSLFDPVQVRCVDLWEQFDWSRLLVFSPLDQPCRKVATHTHLETLSSEERGANLSRLCSRLARLLGKGLDAIQQKDIPALGKAMNCYAGVLADHGFEIDATAEDRRVLGAVRGVCGVKGSGALQADLILVLLVSEADSKSITDAAADRGLKLICNGLTRQPGIVSNG